MSDIKDQVLSILQGLRHVGDVKHRKITVAHLAAMLGVLEKDNTQPNLRRKILKMIEDGHPICSDRNGYWLTSSRAEEDEYIQNLEGRIAGNYKRINLFKEACGRGHEHYRS